MLTVTVTILAVVLIITLIVIIILCKLKICTLRKLKGYTLQLSRDELTRDDDHGESAMNERGTYYPLRKWSVSHINNVVSRFLPHAL